jgi:NADH:ubiquinone oxidoreductase subunit F (NADH-binding)
MTRPRLLDGVGPSPIGYERHCHVHGELPPSPTLRAELERSGLRGRGGASFPLSTKLEAVCRARGKPVVVVNACEGEPMSAKDRLLLRRAPQLVLDGAHSLATAIGARDVIVAIDEREHELAENVGLAIGDRPRAPRVSFELTAVPSGYVSGQETALVRWCNEQVAKPRWSGRRVSERGIGRRPTLVGNAETVAHVALIARHGAAWFRAVGTEADPGTVLVTISGAVRAPGVYEIAHGDPLGSLLAAAGGVTEPARAFLVGGYSGSWIDAAQASAIHLSPGQLRPLGARLGPGIVVVLGESACPVEEIARAAIWLTGQSAGQCGPCVHGLAAIAGALSEIRDGRAGDGRAGDGRGGDGRRALARVERWCEQVAGRGACRHPDGAAGLVASALRVFAREMTDHAAGGRCDVCRDARARPASRRPQRRGMAGVT